MVAYVMLACQQHISAALLLTNPRFFLFPLKVPTNRSGSQRSLWSGVSGIEIALKEGMYMNMSTGFMAPI